MRNDFEIDRDMQRRNVGNNGYTGIVGNMQDQAIIESMGGIYDRSHEHLGTSDAMIIRTRRRLLEAARAFERGVPAPGVDNPEVYRVRSAVTLPPEGGRLHRGHAAHAHGLHETADRPRPRAYVS